jgi:hypothetical protein
MRCALLAKSKAACPTPNRFCPKGVGVRLADDLPGTGSKRCGAVSQK